MSGVRPLPAGLGCDTRQGPPLPFLRRRFPRGRAEAEGRHPARLARISESTGCNPCRWVSGAGSIAAPGGAVPTSPNLRYCPAPPDPRPPGARSLPGWVYAVLGGAAALSLISTVILVRSLGGAGASPAGPSNPSDAVGPLASTAEPKPDSGGCRPRDPRRGPSRPALDSPDRGAMRALSCADQGEGVQRDGLSYQAEGGRD